MQEDSIKFRLGITGLPGAGKTSLAMRLAPRINRQDRNKEIAYVDGDSILPKNIVAVCSMLNRFVVEHICLAQLLSGCNENLLDAIVLLDIPISQCQERIRQRKGHEVGGIDSLQLLELEIKKNIESLTDDYGVHICNVDFLQQKYIACNNLTDYELMRFLFPNKKIIDGFLGMSNVVLAVN